MNAHLKRAPRTPALTLALAVVCLPYLMSGVAKLVQFEGAIREMAGVGLPMPAVFAALTIALQLGASAMVISGRGTTPAAIALIAFTMAATVLAHAFWRHEGSERFHQMNTFVEHVALCAAFALAALHDARNRRPRQCPALTTGTLAGVRAGGFASHTTPTSAANKSADA